jgi:ubiquinone/menaquinone biosynthesis C-methylase UbiE
MNSTPQNPWEEAYRRFETPEEEIRKFIHRLKLAGVDRWPKDARIVELFCGRGNGLHALDRLGFSALEGVDLSPRLAGEYSGPAKITVADCRRIPFPDNSRDILIVQGGLHHLPALPQDVSSTLGEANRVLASDGRFVLVEPWMTPFLSLVHTLMVQRPVRKLWKKMDALAEMTHYEQDTYFPWLAQPKLILDLLQQHFTTEKLFFRWGKIHFVGRKGAEKI